MSDLNDLATDVQNFVPRQPMSRYGDEPVPLDMSWDAARGLWFVKFVKAVRRDRRQWGYANGPTLTDALNNARAIQRGR